MFVSAELMKEMHGKQYHFYKLDICGEVDYFNREEMKQIRDEIDRVIGAE